MQIAKCAVKGTDFPATARSLEFQVEGFGLLRRTIAMAGFGEAVFPNKTPWAMDSLAGGDILQTDWRSAVFHGADALAGPVTARLLTDRTRQTNRSFVTSIALTSHGPFFPARSRHQLWFQISLPRFGIVLEAREPLVIGGIIDAIPPIDTVFQLESPLDLHVVSGPAHWRWLFRHLRVIRCDVRAMKMEGLRTSVSILGSDAHSVTCALRFRNESTEPFIRIAWMVWPEPAAPAGTSGSLTLGRDEFTRTVRLDRSVLEGSPWLATVVKQPFTTTAAQVVRFPAP